MKSIQADAPSIDDVIPASKKTETLTEVKKTLVLMLIGGTLHKNESGPISKALFHINTVLSSNKAKEGKNG